MALTLPSSMPAAAPDPVAARLDRLLPPLADARLLLVDDDPGMIQQMARVLSGYSQLRFATDGAQALSLAHGWQPELVLLDVEMPGLDGLEVCRRLKADPLLAEVPVLFVTQHNDARVEAAMFELGAADYVAKPVAGPALRARVAMQLRLRRTAQYLARLARRDGVTGVADRPQFDDELGQELKRARRSGRPLALLLAAVQDLPGYAQRHGQGAADNALRHVARLAQQVLQRPGDLVARHGPDTFALLLPDTTAAGAAALAGRLQQSMADSGDASAPGVWVGIGIGDGDLDAAAQAALAAARAGGGLHLSATHPGGGHEPPLAV